MKKLNLLKCAALGAVTLMIPLMTKAASAAKPNIIYILVDDK